MFDACLFVKTQCQLLVVPLSSTSSCNDYMMLAVVLFTLWSVTGIVASRVYTESRFNCEHESCSALCCAAVRISRLFQFVCHIAKILSNCCGKDAISELSC